MAPKHSRARGPAQLHRYDRRRTYLGDIRRAPIGVGDGGEADAPYMGIWVDAASGVVVSSVVAIDDPAAALAEGLVNPAASLERGLDSLDEVEVGATALVEPYMLPGKAVVFDPTLADAMRPRLASRAIALEVSPRIAEFDEILDSLLERVASFAEPMELDLPDELLESLCAAAERLWRAKPWRYAYDNPPIGVEWADRSSPPVYVAVLGAGGELAGLAIYTSLADYEAMVGEGPESAPTTSAAEDEEAAALATGASLRHRVYVLSFDKKAELDPAIRERMARAGWSRRRGVVPTFVAYGAGKPPAFPSEAEVRRYAPVVDAVVAFVDECRDRIPVLDYLPVQLRADVTTNNWPGPQRFRMTMPPDAPPRRRARRRR
jgi:hypothetical protein